MFHSVLHERLLQRRRDGQHSQFEWHIDFHPQSFFETSAFDGQIHLDELQLLAQSDEIASGCAATTESSPSKYPSPAGSRLDEISNRREGVE